MEDADYSVQTSPSPDLCAIVAWRAAQMRSELAVEIALAAQTHAEHDSFDLDAQRDIDRRACHAQLNEIGVRG